MSYRSRIERAFENAPVLPLNRCSRYVIISDCHRGCGTSNDNFLKNQNLYFTALNHYYAQGFTYIELGDGDEELDKPLGHVREHSILTAAASHLQK